MYEKHGYGVCLQGSWEKIVGQRANVELPEHDFFPTSLRCLYIVGLAMHVFPIEVPFLLQQCQYMHEMEPRVSAPHTPSFHILR